jgi:hypothetical protein
MTERNFPNVAQSVWIVADCACAVPTAQAARSATRKRLRAIGDLRMSIAGH